MLSRRLLLTTALVAASAALPGTVRADEPIKVVATFSILGDMVGVVGGDAIELTTLVGRDGDAHVYQPTPQAAKAVSEADVLVINGLEFEGWLERLTEAASFDGQLVVATDGVDVLDFEDGHDDHDGHGHDDHSEHDHDDHGHDEEHAEHKHGDHGHDEDHAEHKHDEHDHGAHKHDDHDHGEDHAEHKHDDHDHGEDHAEHGHDDHDHGEEHAGHDHDDHGHKDHDDHEEHAGHDDHHGHDHGEFDPHAWQSIDNAMIYVDNIAAGLAKADPENAATYFTNRASYVEELEALQMEISTMMTALPDDKRTVVTSHDAFGYFGDAYDLVFEAPQGLSTESEASAADVAALITQIREEGISAVFVETITDNRLMEQIANETGAVIGGTLYSDSLSEADGPAATYIDMMRHNAKTISSAIGS